MIQQKCSIGNTQSYSEDPSNASERHESLPSFPRIYAFSSQLYTMLEVLRQSSYNQQSWRVHKNEIQNGLQLFLLLSAQGWSWLIQ